MRLLVERFPETARDLWTDEDTVEVQLPRDAVVETMRTLRDDPEFGFFMLASVGLPGLSGFVGEFLVLVGSFAYAPAVAGVATITMIFTAGYLLWMYQRLFFGEMSAFLHEIGSHLTDMRPVETLTLVPLATLVVVFGLFPGLVLHLVDGTVTSVLNSLGRATAINLLFWQ